MKKYKHKKTKNIAKLGFNGFYYTNTLLNIPKDMIEDCDDWKEIKICPNCVNDKCVEQCVSNNEYNILSFKEWEITSLTSPYGPVLLTNPSTFDIFLNKMKGYAIHSVKRLSDNVEFKIGDKIKDMGHNLPILSFDTEDNSLIVFTGPSRYDLSVVKKVEKVFTTEDGIDIFESNTIYKVDSYFTIECKIAGKYKHSNKNHPVEYWYNDDKYFSTKEKAEKYILMNKPCLSIMDIVLSADNYLIEELKQLVKSKL